VVSAHRFRVIIAISIAQQMVRRKAILIGSGLILSLLFSQSQSTETCSDISAYYQNIDFNAVNLDLKTQLKALINPHIVVDYDTVWLAFDSVDVYLPSYPCNPANESYIPDIYSNYCWDPEKVTMGGECGNYSKEGDCYNREHIWPKSWFGGFDYGANAQTDLFELWPSDGYVNGLRGNNPLGVVVPSQVSYISTNGCLLGLCDTAADGYQGDCFEPPDIYKGDIARSYFYLSTAYMDEWACCDTDGTNASSIKPWMENILRSWHEMDSVDDFERSRNDVICSKWQGNRNPFIDYPELVDQIEDF
jgi:endonuclease I